MIAEIATATEMQNNFGKYLSLVMSGKEIIVTKNGREVGRFVPKDAPVPSPINSLVGILKDDMDLDEIRMERLMEKYGSGKNNPNVSVVDSISGLLAGETAGRV